MSTPNFILISELCDSYWATSWLLWVFGDKINVFVQERRNSIANALELRLSCTYPSKWSFYNTKALEFVITVNMQFPFHNTDNDFFLFLLT